jgi:hypothetical protein
MDLDLSEVQIGIVVNLQILREVLKGLNVNGRRFWIASDPDDALENGSLTIGHGDPNCVDRLNTLYYRIPIVGDGGWDLRADRLIVMFEQSTATAEAPDYYMENGRLVQDSADEFFRFYQPVERALIARLQTRN